MEIQRDTLLWNLEAVSRKRTGGASLTKPGSSAHHPGPQIAQWPLRQETDNGAVVASPAAAAPPAAPQGEWGSSLGANDQSS
ncbi:unnamed protein product [Pleuronectes platessa]|uniref:Uncharacterized protein n=1 Tax=Pleuronectes platessa TaxID=8262 RepID=A0A9N7TK38_PLEPL|nr:unnamed protein product [Pleuronectes platessa]